MTSRKNGKGSGRPPPPVEYQFKPGNPGRPKGSRNKLGEAFVADLYADWEKHGLNTIARVRDERPQDYLKVIALILPKDLNVNVNKFESATDDELVARIRSLDSAIRPFLDAYGEGGAAGGVEAAVRH